MKFSLKSFSGKVPSNGQLDFNVHGDKILAVNIPSSGFAVAFDNGEEVFIKSGIQYGSSGWILNTIRNAFPKIADALAGFTYDKISIINHTSAAANIEFLAGFGDVDDKSTQIVGNVATVEKPLEPYFNGRFVVNSNGCFVNGNEYKRAQIVANPTRKYIIIENCGTSEFTIASDYSDMSYETLSSTGEYGYSNLNVQASFYLDSEAPYSGEQFLHDNGLSFFPSGRNHSIRLAVGEKIGISGSSVIDIFSENPIDFRYLAFK